MKILILLACFSAFFQLIVFSQQSDSAVIQTEYADTTELNFWQKHNVKFAAIPMVNYDPALGWNFAALTNAFFKVSPGDTISPLSMAGAMAGMTTNKTWYWAIYTRMYINQDNWRITLGYGDASVNFQFYDEVNGGFMDFNTLNDFFISEVQRRVYKRWYVGLKYINRKATTTFEGLASEEKKNMSNLGFVLSHDTRDFIYNPHTGDYLNFKTGHNREAWGSDYKYDEYNTEFAKFFPLAKDETLATKLSAFIATGDVPFEGQNVVGREDIRGYTNGKHRAKQVYAMQAEYRWNFYKKWGMVAFGGIATAVDQFNEISWNGILPGVGVGGRFMAIPSEKINVGVDVAVGREDWGIYFRIGETFGDK